MKAVFFCVILLYRKVVIIFLEQNNQTNISNKRKLTDMTGFTSLSGLPKNATVYDVFRQNNVNRCSTNRYKVPRLAYVRTGTLIDIFIILYLKKKQDDEFDGTKFGKDFENDRVLPIDISNMDLFSQTWNTGYCFLDIYCLYELDKYPDWLKRFCWASGRELIHLGNEFVAYYCNIMADILKEQFSLVEHKDMIHFHKVYYPLYCSCLNALYSNFGYKHKDLEAIYGSPSIDFVVFESYKFIVNYKVLPYLYEFLQIYNDLFNNEQFISVNSINFLEV